MDREEPQLFTANSRDQKRYGIHKIAHNRKPGAAASRKQARNQYGRRDSSRRFARWAGEWNDALQSGRSSITGEGKGVPLLDTITGAERAPVPLQRHSRIDSLRVALVKAGFHGDQV